jgi:hypothetical protein
MVVGVWLFVSLPDLEACKHSLMEPPMVTSLMGQFFGLRMQP